MGCLSVTYSSLIHLPVPYHELTSNIYMIGEAFIYDTCIDASSSKIKNLAWRYQPVEGPKQVTEGKTFCFGKSAFPLKC